MTVINLIRNRLGLMPSDYSFYRVRGKYILTISGYKTAIGCLTIGELKAKAWADLAVRTVDEKDRRLGLAYGGAGKAVDTGVGGLKIVVARAEFSSIVDESAEEADGQLRREFAG